MSRSPFLQLTQWVIVAAAMMALAGCHGADGPREMRAGDQKISGPYSHENLSIYLIHGEDRFQGKQYITLQEALDQNLIKVHETGNVNQLAIENTSVDREVYVQSGDIVKGGQQDRTIAMDFVCPPKAKLPIDAFCVEQGRWSRRGGEDAAMFKSSNYAIAGNASKVAVKDSAGQQEVWRQVQVMQGKVSGNLGQQVNAAESATSLQLSLENKKLQETTDQYVKSLSGVAARPDVIGYAFAVNGKVRSADVYASRELFRKLWPKLLHSSAVEAVADLQKDKKFEPATLQAVRACMEDADKGKSAQRKVTDRVEMVTRESDGNLCYETRDSAKAGNAWIHRSYLTKDEETRAALEARDAQRNMAPQQQGQQRLQQELNRQNRLPNPTDNPAPNPQENPPPNK